MKTKPNPFLRPSLAFASLLTLATTAHAVDYTWTGTAGNWTDTTWSPGPITGPTAITDRGIINSGNVTVTDTSVNSNVTVSDGGTLSVTGSGKLYSNLGWQPQNLTIQNGGALEVDRWDGNGSLGQLDYSFGNLVINGGTVRFLGNSNGTSEGQGFTIGANGATLQSDAPSGQTWNINRDDRYSGAYGISSPSSGILTLSGSGNGQISKAIPGAGSVVKSGSGTWTLSGNNTFSGGLTINGGTLVASKSMQDDGAHTLGTGFLTINNGGTLRSTRNWATSSYWNGTSVGAITINQGGTWSIEAFGQTIRNGLFLNGGIITATASSTDWGALHLMSGVTAGDGVASSTSSISADTALSGGQTITVNESSQLNYSGVIHNQWSSTGAITKAGTGTLTLTGANTYTGDTTVEAGILSLGDGTTHTNLSDGAAVSIAAGAIVNLNFSGSDTIGKLIINGETLSGGTYDSTTHPLYFTGSGSLIVLNQSGIWTSTVDGNWSSSGNWDADVIATGFDKNAIFSAGAGTGSITVTLDTPRVIGNLAFSNENYTLAGSNTLTLDAASTPAISVASELNATVSANLGGTQGIEKIGLGTLTLTGTKSYTGDTTVTEGTLAMGATAGTGHVCPIQGALTVNSGATLRLTDVGFGYAGTTGSSVNLNTATLVVDSGEAHMGFNGQANLYMADGSSLTPATAGNTVQFATKNINSTGDSQNTISANLNLRTDGNAGQHTFYVDDGSTAADLLISGNLSDQWPQQTNIPAASLTKTGGGTMVITGTNTYDGNTTVSDGVLEVSVTGSLQFRPTTNGANNSVSGSATSSLSFLGSVSIDLTAANATNGNLWNLLKLDSFTTAPTLTPAAVTSTTLGAFTKVSPGVWELPVSGAKWVFTEATGNLAYATTATDYDSWKTDNGVTGTPSQDDDNDGITNYEEYAFGLDPTGGSSVNPITVPLSKTTGRFSYTRRDTNLTNPPLTYTIWYSTDLVTWLEDTGVVEGSTTLDGEVETVPMTLSTSLLTNPKLFIQVRAH